MAVLPFSGLRVLDLSQLAAGPLVTQLLSDFGAEVLRIESESYILTGGGSRMTRPEGSTSLNTGYFHNKFCTNARSITIDLNQPDGAALFLRLAALSDVVIDNLRPAVTEKWGLTYPRLREVNPEIIVMQMPTMGQGPRSFYGGLSWGIQAMAGLNGVSGYPDRPPVSPSPWSHPDTSCNPFHGMVAVMTALYHRAMAAQGQYIEVSQYESTINYMGSALLEYSANGRSPGPRANDHPAYAPQGVYPCLGEDRWLALSVQGDQEWGRLQRVVGDARLLDSRFGTVLGRHRSSSDLDAILGEWTAVRAAEDTMALLQGEGIAGAVVSNPDDLLHKDPQLKARDHWLNVDHPEMGQFLTEAWGFRLSDTPMKTRERAPLLGEHNEYVFQDVLGLAEDEINAYIVDGVLR